MTTPLAPAEPPLPSLSLRAGQLEEQVIQVYDWTLQADERLEQQRNRLDFPAQGIRHVRTDPHQLTNAVDKLDGMVGELLTLIRPPSNKSAKTGRRTARGFLILGPWQSFPSSTSPST